MHTPFQMHVASGAFIGLIVGFLVHGAAALAYTCAYSSCNTMGGSDCTPEVSNSSRYSSQVSSAVSAWNTASTYIGPRTSTSSVEVTTTASSYGTSGAWAGIEALTSVGRCSTTTWANSICSAAMYLNRSYMDSYASRTRQAVVTHELGHAFGLGHSSSSSIMYYSASTVYLSYGIYTPQSDDANGITYLNSSFCSGV